MASPSGLPYFLPHTRMDAIKMLVRDFFVNAYTQPKPHATRRPFHLGWTFDLAVVVVLLIAATGYFAV